MKHPIPGRPRSAWGARALAAAAALCTAAALAQKIDDVPPAVQNNMPPNFMFMVDNSGSMNNIVPAAPYSAGAAYQATCSGSNITVVPTSASIELRVQNGLPRVEVNGTVRPHVSVRSSSSTAAYCFNNTATYGARLLANGGSASDRSPDNSYLESQYSGHFLNWYFGNFGGPATGWGDRKRVGTGAVETRMEIAKRAARSTIDALPVPASGRAAVRVGLSTYRGSGDGGQLRIAMQDLTTASRAALNTSIDSLSPGGLTPLATTFADIGRYLSTGYTGNVATARDGSVQIDTLLQISGTDNPTPRNACLAGSPVACNTTGASAAQKPIQQWCQRTSIFAMTDGKPTNDRGFNNNAYIRDYDGDCSGLNSSSCRNNGAPSGWDQKIGRVYEAAGSPSEGSDYMDDVAKLLFDVDWRPDLQPTRGPKRNRNNISTYMIGFADPTVQNDPLLINTARQGGGKFIAASDGPTLIDAFRDVITDALAKDAAAAAVSVTTAQITAESVGYASSFNSGSWYGDLIAYSLDITTGLQNGPVLWSARDRLNGQAPGSRKIASFAGGTGVPFTTANGGSFRAGAPSLSDGVINYTRGDRTGEGTTFRPRVHLLGDIINAEPVVVNYPGGPVVYQAANDGMLHAFDGRVAASASTRGQELWAYVPSLVHARLAGRADPLFSHEFLVDATPAVAEIGGGGTTGRVLVGGLGKGGAGYYALDITSGTAASEAVAAGKVLWEFKPANMGYSFGTPVIVNTS
ncbi:MAG TPA: PilC/PilY family type IV pilus protein, partial [Ramlibacter sp.]